MQADELAIDNERLRDELFWIQRRAEQAEQDAACFLERLGDAEDRIEYLQAQAKKR